MFRKNLIWIILVLLLFGFMLSFSAGDDEEKKSRITIQILSTPEVETHKFTLDDFEEGEEKVFGPEDKEIKVKRENDKLIVTLEEDEETMEIDIGQDDEIMILEGSTVIMKEGDSQKKVITILKEDDSDGLALKKTIVLKPHLLALDLLPLTLKGLDPDIDKKLAEIEIELEGKLEAFEGKEKDFNIIIAEKEGALAELEEELSHLAEDLHITVEASDIDRIRYRCPKGDTTLWVDKDNDKGSYSCPNDGQEMKTSKK
jgi:hypothetical protein